MVEFIRDHGLAPDWFAPTDARTGPEAITPAERARKESCRKNSALETV